MTNDRDIWSRFKSGDDESLTLVYSENFKKLYLFGMKITTNQTIVEDSIQDLFSDLVRNRKKLGDTNNIHFYLLKSFKRKLVRQLQKENRYRLKNKDEDFEFNITYSVEHFIIQNETADLKFQSLQLAIAKLKPRQKEAIYLRFTEELEYNEIAEMMEMSIESCRNLLFRAIKSLRDSLKGDTSIFLFFLKKLT